MKANISSEAVVLLRGNDASSSPFLLLLLLVTPWIFFSLYLLINKAGEQLLLVDFMAGIFIFLAAVYFILYGTKATAWFSVPILLTFRALLEYIALPIWRLSSGADRVDSIYVLTMAELIIGFGSFWLGSLLFLKKSDLKFIVSREHTTPRITWIAAILFVVGLIATIVIWQAGLYAYTAQLDLVQSSLAIIQWLGLVASMLNVALVISAIEVFGKKHPNKGIQVIFVFAAIFSIIFGIISGMKSQILEPLIGIIAVYAITKGRLPRLAVLLPLLLAIIYPFENAYRVQLDNGYKSSATTVSGEWVILKNAASYVISRNSNDQVASEGFKESGYRLDVLTFTHDVIGLSDPKFISQGEHLWLAPIFPFIPRILWRNKPVLIKASLLNVELYGSPFSSSAVTPIGDLYSMYSSAGVIIGMFIYGACLQLYMNLLLRDGALRERGVLIYVAMLLPLINLEADVFTLISRSIQLGIIMVIVTYLIYGKSPLKNSNLHDPQILGAA